MILLELNLALFLGSLHPVVVHLPIGFLLIAFVFYILGRKTKFEYLIKALPVILFLSSASAIAASFLGWLLASEGGYADGTLFWHRWLGILIAITSTAAWLWSIGLPSPKKLVKKNPNLKTIKVPMWSAIGLLLVLMITGHLGGNLTHGEGYLLKHAPVFVQKILGASNVHSNEIASYPQNPDSILIYNHIIQNIFDDKCISCHNESKKKGDLQLMDQMTVLEGGDNGEVFVQGASHESELIHRVTLNSGNKKFMPPKGDPLSYYEIKLMEYWVDNGMSFEQSITDETIPENIRALISREFGLSSHRKSYIEIASVDPFSEKQANKLRENGFDVSPISRGMNFLQVRIKDSLSASGISSLSGVKEQLSWLELSKSGIKDEDLKTVGDLKNLTKLRLDQNPISSSGVEHLKSLKHLEVLNLYGTELDDEGLSAIAEIKTLQKLYVWQTNVTEEGISRLQEQRPGLEIVF